MTATCRAAWRRCISWSTHGVNCSISTNNVLNPFTPFGDCSLVRMANLYANVAQIGGRPSDMELCLSMVTERSARLLNLRDYGIAEGKLADVVVHGLRGRCLRDRRTGAAADGVQAR